jgi:hypothetical protein
METPPLDAPPNSLKHSPAAEMLSGARYHPDGYFEASGVFGVSIRF